MFSDTFTVRYTHIQIYTATSSDPALADQDFVSRKHPNKVKVTSLLSTQQHHPNEKAELAEYCDRFYTQQSA